MKTPPPGVPVLYRPPALSRADAPLAKIVVPYTRVHADTRAALEPHADRVEYVDVSTEGAYWCLFRDLWKAREDFILIEHDIVPGRNTIGKFDACPESWCTCSYEWYWKPAYHWIEDHSTKVLNASLGCTRFRAELMTAVPELGSDKVLKIIKKRSARRGPIPYWLVDDIVNLGTLFGRYAWCKHERVGHRAS